MVAFRGDIEVQGAEVFIMEVEIKKRVLVREK